MKEEKTAEQQLQELKEILEPILLHPTPHQMKLHGLIVKLSVTETQEEFVMKPETQDDIFYLNRLYQVFSNHRLFDILNKN